MEDSLTVKIAEKICPAVITIVVSKDLPKIEGFSFMPFGGQNFAIPNIEKGKKQKTKIGGGSAFIISADGMILTSQHVVSDPDADYSVILGLEEKYPAKVLARDPINDIAVLKIESNRKDFPFLELGNSDEMKLGQSVIAVGNALGEFHDTVSTGIISGLSRYITAFGGMQGNQSERLRGLIQTDAAINPGNSGGPLVSMEGKVIGINTAVVMGAQNIGFAIPVNYAKKDIKEVLEHGTIKRPFLGVKYIILNKEISQKNNLPVKNGALVVRETLGNSPIIKGSSAEKAGIKEFDIILSLNGEDVTEDNPLSHILDKCKIGEIVPIEILRSKKKKIKLKAKLLERK